MAVVYVCRDNEDISNDVLKLGQFPVPQFMVDKMKKFMKSVQGESGREGGEGRGSEGV